MLDAGSLLGRNRGGVNLVLVRVEDSGPVQARLLGRDGDPRGGPGAFGRPASLCRASEIPIIVAALPSSPRLASHPDRAALVAAVEEQIESAVQGCDTLHWLGQRELAPYNVGPSYDEFGDRVGHMPYLPLLQAALSTAIARRLQAIKSPPHKVIALDCDNTIWQGVVGEDGPHGLKLGLGAKALQEFVVAQQAAGMLVCLVSKNVEQDVLDVFDLRADFPLKREHLVSWRINWQPKSQALAELAEELNLGLESFIFLDDNPVECAEVRAALPQVLTLQVPPDEQIAEFLRHNWAFDRLNVTDEDRRRTRMYRQNVDRVQSETQAGDVGEFLASLQLKIGFAVPAADRWARASQLTQRTNQFNVSTIRRSESELRQLRDSGYECVGVDVADRFGDYGLVGLMLARPTEDALVVDTFLLSCRVLGRGVEHAMLAELGRKALEHRQAFVELRFVPTAKNQPAANFLAAVGGGFALPVPEDGTTRYRIPAEVAAKVAYRPGDDAHDQLEFARTGGRPTTAPAASAQGGKSAFYSRVATELHRPEAVLAALAGGAASCRSLESPVVEPHTAVQRELVDIWRRLLKLDRVGIRDRFEDLGGTSIQAAQMFGQILTQFDVSLPMSAILEAPDVERLAETVVAASRGEARGSLKCLKTGQPGGPVIFLVHDGDGETLLYLNLARHLPAGFAVYGLEPLAGERCPLVHTTIPQMAAHYREQACTICPAGPYFVGGLCAGGTIAFEMARQWRAAGARVGLVALLDAADVRHAPKNGSTLRGAAGRTFDRRVADRPQNAGEPARIEDNRAQRTSHGGLGRGARRRLSPSASFIACWPTRLDRACAACESRRPSANWRPPWPAIPGFRPDLSPPAYARSMPPPSGDTGRRPNWMPP